MSQAKPPRVWVSNANPKKGEVLRVRAQMEHVMESGLRTDPANGKVLVAKQAVTVAASGCGM